MGRSTSSGEGPTACAGSGRCTAYSASLLTCAPTATRRRSTRPRRSSKRYGGAGWRGRSCVRTRSSYAATATLGGPTPGGSRRVATEVDSSIFAEGFCFLAAPKRGERPHQRQSEPNFSLRRVSQLGSKHTFLCKPLEHDRYVHGEKPVSMEIPTAKYFMKFSSVVCRPDDNPQVMPRALSSPVGRPAALGHARAVIL